MILNEFAAADTVPSTLKLWGSFKALFFFKFQRKAVKIISITLALVNTVPSRGIHLGMIRFSYTCIYMYI